MLCAVAHEPGTLPRAATWPLARMRSFTNNFLCVVPAVRCYFKLHVGVCYNVARKCALRLIMSLWAHATEHTVLAQAGHVCSTLAARHHCERVCAASVKQANSVQCSGGCAALYVRLLHASRFHRSELVLASFDMGKKCACLLQTLPASTCKVWPTKKVLWQAPHPFCLLRAKGHCICHSMGTSTTCMAHAHVVMPIIKLRHFQARYRGENQARTHSARQNMRLTSGTTGDGVLGMVITSSPFSALALMPAQVARYHAAATHQRARVVTKQYAKQYSSA